MRIPSIIELRQYTLHPGQRENLIELFDRELIESQEAVGMQVLGQFRDLDRPDVFTWMRGFDDMAGRARALEAFYDGPVWARHRDAANATMQTVDNVRLLRPGQVSSDFLRSPARPAVAAVALRPGLFVVTIYTLTEPARSGFSEWFGARLMPLLTETRGRPIATFETEPSANTFPRLPVREGEHAFVTLARFADAPAYDTHRLQLANELEGADEARRAMIRQLRGPVETWRLTPTARSRLVP